MSENKEDIRHALLEAGYSPRTATTALDKGSSVKECLKWCWTNVGIRFGNLRQGKFKKVVDELEFECHDLILQSEKVMLSSSNSLPAGNTVNVEADTEEEKQNQEGRHKIMKSIGIAFCLQVLAAGIVAGVIFIPGDWRFCGICKGQPGTLRYDPHHCEFKACKPGQLDSNLWVFFMLWAVNMILIIFMAIMGVFCSAGRCLAFLRHGIEAQGVWTLVLLLVLGLTYGMLYAAGPDNFCRSPIELPHVATALPYPCELTKLSWYAWCGVVAFITFITCSFCAACGMSLRAFRSFIAHEDDEDFKH